MNMLRLRNSMQTGRLVSVRLVIGTSHNRRCVLGTVDRVNDAGVSVALYSRNRRLEYVHVPATEVHRLQPA